MGNRPSKTNMRLALAEANRTTARQQAHDALRRGILGGTLEAGSRLVQSEIALALGLSTTPVREALRDLASDGLVKFDDYRGAVVQQPDLADIRDIYKLRIVLEPLALRESLTSLPDEELERASELQALMDGEDDLGSWLELNNRFHSVFEGMRSPRMNAILRNLRDSAVLVIGFSNRIRPNLIAASNHQHHQLLQACHERHADAAARIVEQHVRETLEAMEGYFSQTGDPAAGG